MAEIVILNPLSIGYISGEAINNQFLITGFGIKIKLLYYQKRALKKTYSQRLYQNVQRNLYL